jgi:predicted MFS family arabinose efflux permease
MRPLPPQGRATLHRAVADFGEGVRYAARRPAICAMLSVTFMANLLPLPFLQFLPVFARDVLHLDPVRYGTLGSTVGLGALVSTIILATQAQRWRPDPTFLTGALLMGVALVPFALTGEYPIALACLFLFGCGQGLYASLQGPVILLRGDAALRGRLMGLLVFSIGVWPLGMLLMGALIDGLGPAIALAGAAVAFGLALSVLILYLPRLYALDARGSALKRFDGQAEQV